MDNEEMTFMAIDSEGKEVEFDILFSFDSEETGKHYIVYTDNTEDEDGNINVYASAFASDNDESELLPIETEKEWKIIEIILEELQNEISS